MLLKFVVASLLFLALTVAPVEWYVRNRIINQSFSIYQVQERDRPYFKLVPQYESPRFTIHDSRREVAKRGLRSRKVAFVGDSVTFGSGVEDSENFVEAIQKGQSHFDAYNYGVPGYSLVEVEEMSDKILAENGPFDRVIYTFNFNDIHPMTVGYLSLLQNSDRHFTTIERYQGLYGALKLFAKDHLKSFFVIKHLVIHHILPADIDGAWDSVFANEQPVKCYDDLVREVDQGQHRQLLSYWSRMYRDPFLIAKLTHRLAQMRSKVEQGNAEFDVLVFYDFHLMEDDGPFFRQQINTVLKNAGIEIVDMYPLFERNYKQCGFYSDIGHPGELGNRLIGEFALDHIFNKQLMSPQ